MRHSKLLFEEKKKVRRFYSILGNFRVVPIRLMAKPPRISFYFMIELFLYLAWIVVVLSEGRYGDNLSHIHLYSYDLETVNEGHMYWLIK